MTQKRQLVFASNNANKVEEIRKILPDHFELLSLEDIHFYDEIEETGDTLKENAAIKARVVFDACNLPCFADDSGLMVDALDGRPGVKSARYAGEPVNHNANIELLLKELKDQTNRNAAFRTVICYKDAGQELFFEGEIKGEIIAEKRGEGGFGYDPVFVPEQNTLTFAQMPLTEKNTMSHRKRAIAKMIHYFETLTA